MKLLPTRRRRAAVIAFSGLDGAGKSSQAQLLHSSLRERGIDAVVEWVPVAYDPSIDHVKRRVNAILRALRLRPEVPPSRLPANRSPYELTPGKALVRRSNVVRHAWTTFIALTNVVSHWRSVARHSSRHRVVIFDRYTLDSTVRLQAWYGSLGSVAFQSWLVRTFSPRPFRAYLLDVPGETAFARRHEQWGLDELRRQAAIYRENARRHGVRRLDGEAPAAELADEICNDVFAALRRR